MLRLFTKDLVRYLPAQLVPTALGFISIPLFTHVLSAEEYGRYALIMSSVSIMITLLSWLNMSIIRFYPAVPDRERSLLLRTALWAHLGSACILGVITFTLARLLWREDIAFQELFFLGIAIFLLQSTFQLLTQVLRARLRAGIYSFFIVWDKLISLGLGLLLAFCLNLGVAGILGGALVGIAITLPLLWTIALRGTYTFGPLSTTFLRELAWYGVPLMIGQLGAWSINQSDRYLIHFFYGARELGVYSAAYVISHHSISTLNTLFRQSSGPLLAHTWENKHVEATRYLLDSITRLYLVVGIPAVVGISVLAEPIMRVLTSPDFSDGYTTIPWIASGVFFLGLQHRFNHILLLFKRSGTVMSWMLLAGGLNIALNWYLLPMFGYQIAGATTLFSYVFLCVVQALSSKKYLRWSFPYQTLGRSLLSALLMFCAIFFFLSKIHLSPVWTLCTAIPMGMLVYGISMWKLDELTIEERRVLTTYGKRVFS